MISFELLLRDIPNDYSFKKNYLNANSNNIEVLFLGSSHIYFGINPEYFSRKSFNGAHISQSLNFDLAILEKYKDRWTNLKYIIIPLDYFSMYSKLEGGIEKWRVKNYIIYYNISTYGNFWSGFEIFNGKLLSNILRAKSYLFNGKSDITCSKWGFGTAYKSKDSKDLIETGKTASKRHTIELEKNQPIFSKNIQIINSMIEFANSRNIKIIFITCPAYSSYRENLNPIQLDNSVNIIKRLSAKNTNTDYYNFLTDKTFIANDYYDADHLNEIGAKKLTLKIDSIINNKESTNR
ncbi:MAG: hypothetical protein ORN85_06020 [Sediminibacterium sp.]|nr:hypothetical protein [Sediminibacterium sp.]